MGGSVSLNSITTSNNNANGNKQLIVGLSNGEDIRLNMYEQINTIPKSEYIGKDEFEIEYCIASPFNGLGECSKLFNSDPSSNYTYELDNYVITNEGTPCTSLTFRPGSILYETSNWINDRTFQGNRCKILYRGPPIYKNDLFECCTGKRTTNCHETLINNFETSHCNVTMQNFCTENPNDIYCYRWLDTQSKAGYDIALKLYSDICSRDHQPEYCTYMCMYARDYGYPGYCDKALSNWCNNNKNNNLCYCYNPPAEIIPDVEEVLGPKECWIDSCTSSYTNQKWLTTDQMEIKRNCGIRSCIITVGSLMARGSNIIELINNCVAGAISSSQSYQNYIGNSSIKIDQTWGSFFDPVIFLIIMCFIFLCVIYLINNKPIYTIDINE
ncbi:putative myristylated membrane protein [Alphaentomopoxvirus acuprea]|uniref:Putative myristylated membrane protein n=1 Tax=Alphaentomopoxvirus acuprea TaxID=62099 RepID=W6JLC2_9POXV|nr:putative myristylated membrane protein [Anomala cuprea entomopoxvirus]BAO49426.1 putative myristylated membrane protein [Anomala cuprea entomopoxvirus]